jgi:hypothetical protein
VESESEEDTEIEFTNPIVLMGVGVWILGSLLVGIALGTYDSIRGQKSKVY